MKWDGRLLPDWFWFNVELDLVNVKMFIDTNKDIPLVGTEAIVIWMLLLDKMYNKKTVVNWVSELVQAMQSLVPDTKVYFVTHVPMEGDMRLKVINFNNNLMFAVCKLWRDGKTSVETVAIHHWCLKQKRKWFKIEDIMVSDKRMLAFLVLD